MRRNFSFFFLKFFLKCINKKEYAIWIFLWSNSRKITFTTTTIIQFFFQYFFKINLWTNNEPSITFTTSNITNITFSFIFSIFLRSFFFSYSKIKYFCFFVYIQLLLLFLTLKLNLGFSLSLSLFAFIYSHTFFEWLFKLVLVFV